MTHYEDRESQNWDGPHSYIDGEFAFVIGPWKLILDGSLLTSQTSEKHPRF